MKAFLIACMLVMLSAPMHADARGFSHGGGSHHSGGSHGGGHRR